jgi:hypothetical protein
VTQAVKLRGRLDADELAVVTTGDYSDATRVLAEDLDVALLDSESAAGDAGRALPVVGSLSTPEVSLPKVGGGSLPEVEAPSVSRRTALVAGGGGLLAALGVGLWSTGVLEPLLGGEQRPVPPDSDRIELSEGVAAEIRNSPALRFDAPADTAVSVYASPSADGPAEVASWYRNRETVNGWTLVGGEARSFVYRSGDRGAFVFVQAHNATFTVDDSAGASSADIVVLELPWSTLADALGV